MLAVAACVAGGGYGVATEPLDRSPILGSEVARRTEALLAAEAAAARARPVEAGPLRVGWAEASLTPPLGTPTAGYGARAGMGISAVADEVHARALAVAVGDGPPAVFLTADVCLWLGELSGKVAARVAPVVPRERLYFGATHTHNGPGGFGRGPIARIALGARDPAAVERIVAAAAAAVRGAVADLSPGAMRELSVAAPEFVENRVVAGDPVEDTLTLVEYRKEDGRRCAWVDYAAHATAINPLAMVCSGDYPGALCRRLVAGGYDAALFFAGETGQSGPAHQGATVHATTVEPAWRMGEAIADRLLALAAEARAPFRPEATLATFRSEVALPPWRVRKLGRVLEPAFATWLLGGMEPRAFVHAIRLGDTVYLGHSFEFSAVIGRRLAARARERGGRLLLTSFNGDHAFYVIPDAYYDLGRPEGSSTLFGPTLGSYLERVSEQVYDAVWALRDAEREVAFDLGAQR